MKYLEILRAKLATMIEARDAAITEAEAIAETIGEDTTDETRSAAITSADEALARATAMGDDIAATEARIGELEKIEARTKNAAKAPFNVNPGTASDDPYEGIDLRTVARTPEVVRDIDERARRAIDQDTGMADEHRTRVDALMRDQRVNRGGAMARHVVATGNPLYRSAFAKLTTQAQPLLTQEEVQAVEQVRSLNITTDASGGYLMPFTLDPTIILTNNGAVNPVRELATVKSVITDNWQGISSAGVTAGYGAESSEVADGTPTLGQPTVKVEKAHAFVPFSMEAEDDLANLSTDVAVMFGDAKDNLEAVKFTLGAGSNEPVGLVTGLVAFNGGSSIVASATADTYAVADVYALQEALPPRWQPNASWQMALAVINLTRKFGSSVSHAFLTDLSTASPPLLLGKRLAENSSMDSTVTGSTTNYLAVYGDIASAYRIHDRIGLSIELVPHLFGANRRPTGERGWYARWRNGANVVNGAAARVLNA